MPSARCSSSSKKPPLTTADRGPDGGARLAKKIERRGDKDGEGTGWSTRNMRLVLFDREDSTRARAVAARPDQEGIIGLIPSVEISTGSRGTSLDVSRRVDPQAVEARSREHVRNDPQNGCNIVEREQRSRERRRELELTARAASDGREIDKRRSSISRVKEGRPPRGPSRPRQAVGDERDTSLRPRAQEAAETSRRRSSSCSRGRHCTCSRDDARAREDRGNFFFFSPKPPQPAIRPRPGRIRCRSR